MVKEIVVLSLQSIFGALYYTIGVQIKYIYRDILMMVLMLLYESTFKNNLEETMDWKSFLYLLLLVGRL